ncbi:unnamed protein product [Blepharisma stoltei]|uniref:Uncharacterized protein n=1 Tax=Blepharisma stoltei TaxID=1481888 RepID=A0AAU9IA09_9CILI|nr:unnamed protein product [Blepharisma stoltei]
MKSGKNVNSKLSLQRCIIEENTQKRGRYRNRTNYLLICSQLLYQWANHPWLRLYLKTHIYTILAGIFW